MSQRNCLLLFGLIVAIIASIVLSLETGPRVLVLPADLRVAAQPGQKKLSLSFIIRNRGRRPLSIKSVTTSCGCSVASLPANLVPGKGESTLTVEATPPSSGEKLVTIHVSTDDLEYGDLECRFTMTGSKPPPYLISRPEPVQFGSVRGGTPVAAEFSLDTAEPAAGGPWLGLAICPLPGSKVEGRVANSWDLGANVVRRRYRFKCTLGQIPDPGSIESEVQICGRDGGDVLVKIPVYLHIRNPVEVAPSALVASVFPEDPVQEFTLNFSADSSIQSFEVVPQSTESDPYSIIRTDARGNRPSYKVRLKSNLDRSINSEILFKTNHPKQALIRIPLLVDVKTKK